MTSLDWRQDLTIQKVGKKKKQEEEDEERRRRGGEEGLEVKEEVII